MSQYQGGAFDGRYVYLSPNGNGAPVQRYDTTGGFTAPTSWTSFDTKVVGDAGVNGFAGAAFDGHNVYFVATAPQPPPSSPVVFMRYDGLAFQSATSWASFDATALSSRAKGYSGATFDGRYLYFAPLWSGYALQYDTTKSFTTTPSWVGFDLGKLGPEGAGFQGAVFDGTYVYFIPEVYFVDGGSTVCNGFLVRYDPSQPFDSPAAWVTFDVATVDPNACGFVGGVFDGRFVYLVPFFNGLAVAARYDTMGAGLKAKSSWSTFAVTTANPSVGPFLGGAFDGRFVYFVPFENAVFTQDGIVARYDTTGTFGDTAAWGTYDLSQVNASAVGLGGAIFDGEYLYFVPESSPVVVRYQARTPRRMPKLPDFFGSFY